MTLVGRILPELKRIFSRSSLHQTKTNMVSGHGGSPARFAGARAPARASIIAKESARERATESESERARASARAMLQYRLPPR